MKTITKVLLLASAIVLCSCPRGEFDIALKSELDNDSRYTDETKQMWSLINAKNAITKQMPGSFQQFWSTDENGFEALFADEQNEKWLLTFAMLKANDGSLIGYVWKRAYSDSQEKLSPEFQQFIYQNGNLKEVEPQIPVPQLTDFPAYVLGDSTVTINGKDSEFYFRSDGMFEYTAHSDNYQNFGEYEADGYIFFYQVRFHWDGEKFIPYEFDYDEYYRYLEEPDEEFDDEGE